MLAGVTTTTWTGTSVCKLIITQITTKNNNLPSLLYHYQNHNYWIHRLYRHHIRKLPGQRDYGYHNHHLPRNMDYPCSNRGKKPYSIHHYDNTDPHYHYPGHSLNDCCMGRSLQHHRIHHIDHIHFQNNHNPVDPYFDHL